MADALVLPVPLVEERRAAPGALEHLGATMSIRVRNHGRLVWEGTSRLAGLEHGGWNGLPPRRAGESPEPGGCQTSPPEPGRG